MIAFSRKSVRAQFSVVNDVIQNDEFRGAPVFAPHFFYKSVDAQWSTASSAVRVLSTINEEQSTQYIALVEIDPVERFEFPELGAASHVLVTQDPDLDQCFATLVFGEDAARMIENELRRVVDED